MWILPLLLACAPPADVPDGQLPPPPPLHASPLVPGRTLVAEASGLPPGSPAWLARGAAPGRGPCPPALGGACLGLRQPALLTSTTVDARGVATFRVRLPATLPAGVTVWLQAAAPGIATDVVARVSADDPLAGLGAAFDDPADAAGWDLLAEVDGTDDLHARFDVDATVPGALVLEPNAVNPPWLADGGQSPAWFQDRKGPFALRELTGDFAVRAHVRVGTTTSLTPPPTGWFNAGGFVIRDPASTDPAVQPDVGDERWLMFNLGHQAGALATELKTTFPDGADPDPESDSSLFLRPAGVASGWLLACRQGDAFRFWRWLDDEAGWTEELPTGATLYVDNARLAGPDYATSGFVRPDLPATVQVGLIANRWADGGGAPVRVAVDEAWVGTPDGDCLNAAVAP